MGKLEDKWNKNNFSVYASEEKTTLKLIDNISTFVGDELVKEVENKTDLLGNHLGSWQGINKPTLSEEGMRAVVEKINDEELPKILSDLNDIVQINVKNLGFIGDGITDNTDKLVNLNITSNTTVLFPKGTYIFNNDGFTFNLLNLNNVTIEGSGKIIVKDNCFNLDNCTNVKINGIEIERKVQGIWGGKKFGIQINDCKNIVIENTKIKKFTDNISISATTESNNIIVRNNVLQRSSEEPIAVRRLCYNTFIYNNLISEHLGDGILLKGANGVTIKDNVIEKPCYTESEYFIEMTGGNTVPINRGGGITCNSEDGNYFTSNVVLENNSIKRTKYGIVFMSCENVKILNNIINEVYETGIAISGENDFNKFKNISKDIFISGNTINKLMKTTKSTAIDIISTTTVPLENIQVINNNIKPSNETSANDGITAYGNVIVSGNVIEDFDYGINCKDGAIISNNLIKNPNVNATGKRGIGIRGVCTVTNNRIIGGDVKYINAISVWSEVINAIIEGNNIIYNGDENGVNFGTNSKNNILNNNIITVTGTGKNHGGYAGYELFNIINNKRISSSIPTTGVWEKSQRVEQKFMSTGQPKGWICVTSGEPGVWVSEGDL